MRAQACECARTKCVSECARMMSVCARRCSDAGVKRRWGGPGLPLLPVPLSWGSPIWSLDLSPQQGPGPLSLRTQYEPSQDLGVPTLETVAGWGCGWTQLWERGAFRAPDAQLRGHGPGASQRGRDPQMGGTGVKEAFRPGPWPGPCGLERARGSCSHGTGSGFQAGAGGEQAEAPRAQHWVSSTLPRPQQDPKGCGCPPDAPRLGGAFWKSLWGAGGQGQRAPPLPTAPPAPHPPQKRVQSVRDPGCFVPKTASGILTIL